MPSRGRYRAPDRATILRDLGAARLTLSRFLPQAPERAAADAVIAAIDAYAAQHLGGANTFHAANHSTRDVSG